MSHLRIFARRKVFSLALVVLDFSCSEAFGVTAQSSATVSWATAFSSFPTASSLYDAGESLSPPDQSVSFSTDPTNSLTQGLNFGDVNNGASALADGSSLFVESHTTNGSAAVSASMYSILYFDPKDTGPNTLNITVPYTLSTLVQLGVGSASVNIFASLTIFDFNGNTRVDAADPNPALDDIGLGRPNDVTGILSLQLPYNVSDDQGAVLNISVLAESTAAPVKTVPIPGGVALALPMLLPLLASRQKDRVT